VIVYVPVGNGPVRRDYVAAGAGMIVQAHKFRFPKLECPWIMDNGAFDAFLNKYPWSESKFQRTVERLLTVQPCDRPQWALIPDKVADASSLGYSVSWRKVLPDQLRWYLALQDGMRPAHVENALATVRIDGLFVGGSLTWKNENAASWCAFGRAHKLPVHVGRVNGGRRLQWCYNIGASSLDGTGWTMDSRWVEWVRRIKKAEEADSLLFDDVPEDLKGIGRAAERRKAGA
jgi:hypothetical protein